MLNRVSVGIKTFLRDDKLFRAIDGIRRNMPEVQMIIADDGEMTEEKDGVYADLEREGHKVIILPFDSGFGRKGNAIIDSLVRPFLLVGSDDFDFSPMRVKVGIEKMLEVLDRFPVDIASGRLINRGPYEFYLRDRGETIQEVSCTFDEIGIPMDAILCDVTVNYSLIRREVFDKVKFDDEEVIGEGGHGTFFLDVKRAGFKVAYVPGVEIEEQKGLDSERYRMFRRRACEPSRKCFEKRGIKKWVLGSGQVDYERKD